MRFYSSKAEVRLLTLISYHCIGWKHFWKLAINSIWIIHLFVRFKLIFAAVNIFSSFTNKLNKIRKNNNNALNSCHNENARIAQLIRWRYTLCESYSTSLSMCVIFNMFTVCFRSHLFIRDKLIIRMLFVCLFDYSFASTEIRLLRQKFVCFDRNSLEIQWLQKWIDVNCKMTQFVYFQWSNGTLSWTLKNLWC